MRKHLVIVLSLTLAGCTMGPEYHRPAVQIPAAYRTPSPAPAPDASSIADLKWWEVFKDEQLQDLERTALTQNFDLREAITRVDAARANLGITRSNQFPNAAASADI